MPGLLRHHFELVAIKGRKKESFYPYLHTSWNTTGHPWSYRYPILEAWSTDKSPTLVYSHKDLRSLIYTQLFSPISHRTEFLAASGKTMLLCASGSSYKLLPLPRMHYPFYTLKILPMCLSRPTSYASSSRSLLTSQSFS